MPTYLLTDNERSVTMDHVAGVAVRHPQMIAVGGHYGVTVARCVPADPESKGGSEATVRIAKADLIPTDANLLPAYRTWGELVEACDAFMVEVNEREHRSTRRAPVAMLAEEQQRLHPLPVTAYTAVFGETRQPGRRSPPSADDLESGSALPDEKGVLLLTCQGCRVMTGSGDRPTSGDHIDWGGK